MTTGGIMSDTVLVLVNGEVLANGHGSAIANQRQNTMELAQGLEPILSSDLRLVVLHGNKPQVGFVLFRSELASHVLHTIPLDVCGADTQGATGYMLSQAIMNILRRKHVQRRVMCVLTQTLVDTNVPGESLPLRAIGPWFDRQKAEHYRQVRRWSIIEEPGRGYRRAVPSYPVKEILEIENIKDLAAAGNIVIAGGGGGIPVILNAQGEYEGIEAVVESEQLVPIMAQQVKANVLVLVIESDSKFILSGLSIEGSSHLSLDVLDRLLEDPSVRSKTVQRVLKAASQYLHQGGEQVVITTLRSLSDVFIHGKGLRIGSLEPSIELFRLVGQTG
jgi:carbamate kinase